MEKIYVTRPIPEIGIDMLKEKGHEVVVNDAAEDRAATKEEIVTELKKGGCGAILSVLTDKIDGAIMDAGEPSLKIVANYAVGYDNIDVKAAIERNVVVTNTPGVLTETVAEHAFALLLAIARRISEADRFSRAGKYHAWGPKLLLGSGLAGKTLGIVGLGRIGSRVAHHAVNGFDMKIAYTDTKQNGEFEKEYNAKFVRELDDLLPLCDFVSIHVPLLEATKHLINEKRLKLMKPSAYLINTSRGPVVDEAALVTALTNKIIRGAALDVFEEEPKISSGLMKLENVILNPHIASATEETRNKMATIAAENILAVLEGKEPLNPVKPK